ncbi:hypothetical protein [Candidatus Uabimicrobium sp. HlEnr_7]|uniref:hypothetical protein n=1 Tax=Candidatus Uabimicrobium helgolandensis TaxID=3095367 RepID=UPI0035583159
MLKKAILCVFLTASFICSEKLPVVYFNLQMFNSPETVSELTGEFSEYVSYGEQTVPTVVNNSYSKSAPQCKPFYNSDEKPQECFYSLSNPRLVEALLANGYHVNVYMWIVKEEKAVFGTTCTIVGYNQQEQIFIGQQANGSETKISYDYAVKNFRLVEVYSESATTNNWKCMAYNAEDPTKPFTFNMDVASFVTASAQISHEMTINNWLVNDVNCLAHIIPQKLNRGEVEKSVKFSMQIKKKKLSSKGCGGFIWWPVGSKEWDNITWDATKNGRILYLDPTMPLDYPKYGSKNYFHNVSTKCHPCTASTIMPGVWINVKVEGSTIRTRIVKKSTCNIGHGYLDKYNNSTATVVGVVNVWVEK